MVLQFLRRKMQLILKITVILIVPAFVIYFGSSRIRGIRQGQEIAGQMFGEDITMRDFLEAFNWVRFWVYLTRGPEQAPYIDLKAEVRDYLILAHKAERLGIEVSDSEVAAAIASLPFFQKNGSFNRELYVQFLSMRGISPQIFESHVRKMLAISKLSSFLSDCAKVSFWEVVDEYLARNRQMQAKVVLFKPSDFMDEVSVSEEEAKAYFEEHKEEFKTPERVSVKFVHIDPSTLAKPEVSQEEIKDYYDLHSQDYHKPERVAARMILVKLPENASADEESAAWEKIRGIMERLRKGEDFAALAKELSEDETTKARGGDLGIVEKGKYEKAMDDLLFSLKEGEFDAVRTSKGLAILKVEKKYPAVDKSLEDVKNEIIAKIEEQKRWEKAEDIAYDVIYDLEDGLDIEDAAANSKLELHSPPPIAFGDKIEGVKDGLMFCMEVFSLAEGEYTREPIKLSDGYYVAQLIALCGATHCSLPIQASKL